VGPAIRALPAVVLALVVSAPPAFAEWQLKPFAGLTFGGDTTLVDVGEGRDKKHLALGVGVLQLGEVVGFEGEFAYAPDYFEGSTGLVLRSSVLTLMGNVVVAMPRRTVEYSLRPYVVGGFGLVRASTRDLVDALSLRENMPAFNVGGGVTGFLTETVGVSWDVRYFRSVRQPQQATGTSIGSPELSFWRANMALALRF
jgi:hypothetical protein